MIVIKVIKILKKRMKKNGNNNELNGRPKGLKEVIDQEMFM
jgi:predicted nucleotide-binding protein (sugar kinase/HSP70/actin superfamily)